MALLVTGAVVLYALCMVAVAGLASARWLEAGLLAIGWRWVHGPERTVRANALAIGLYGVAHALLLALGGAWWLDGASAPGSTLLGYAVTVSLARIWAFSQAFRPLEAEPGQLLASPRHLVRNHDGLRLVLSARAAWPAVLYLVPAMFLVGAHLLLAVLWDMRPRPRVELRLSGRALSVRRTGTPPVTFALAGLRVHRSVAWDGTPLLHLRSDEAEAEIPVGGAPPEDVAWVVRELQRRARRAPVLDEVPEPPSGLRRLVTAGRAAAAPL